MNDFRMLVNGRPLPRRALIVDNEGGACDLAGGPEIRVDGELDVGRRVIIHQGGKSRGATVVSLDSRGYQNSDGWLTWIIVELDHN